MSLLHLEPALSQAPPTASTYFFSPPSDLINPRCALNFPMLVLPLPRFICQWEQWVASKRILGSQTKSLEMGLCNVTTEGWKVNVLVTEGTIWVWTSDLEAAC